MSRGSSHCSEISLPASKPPATMLCEMFVALRNMIPCNDTNFAIQNRLQRIYEQYFRCFTCSIKKSDAISPYLASLTELTPIHTPNASAKANAFTRRYRDFVSATRVSANPVRSTALRARPEVAVNPKGRKAACRATSGYS